MGKFNDLFKSIFLNTDTIDEEDISTNSQIKKINLSDEISEETKEMLLNSLNNIDKKYVIEESKNKVEKELDKKVIAPKVKINSMKAVAEAQRKLENLEQEHKNEEIEKK